MSDLDNAVVAGMLKAKEIGVKMLASDCEAILQTAIASMQGGAKFSAAADADRLRSVARGMSYNDMSEATWKHVILEIAMRLDTGGYTPPDAAIASLQGEAVGTVGHDFETGAPYVNWRTGTSSLSGKELFTYPPDASAEIARLTKELEEARKDAEQHSDLLIEAKAEIQECLDDHCNMMETKPHRPAIWQQLLGSIDAAISKIGGGE